MILLQKTNIKKLILWLLCSFFTFLLLLLICANQYLIPASENVYNVPYKNDQKIFIGAVVLDYAFLIEFDIAASSSSIYAFPKEIKKDNYILNRDNYKASFKNILDKEIDRLILLEYKDLKEFVDLLGGISINNEQGEKITVFGDDFAEIFQANDKSFEYISYCFYELLNILIKNDRVNLIFDYSDISFPDYYDYKEKILKCLKVFSCHSLNGNFENGYYLLY